jgi:hypothetical protein
MENLLCKICTMDLLTKHYELIVYVYIYIYLALVGSNCKSIYANLLGEGWVWKIRDQNEKYKEN